MDFNVFKTAVAKQFERMKGSELFRTQVEKDLLWKTYIDSFPSGSNPIFKERTEHDCQCCKQFIRAVGNVVIITEHGLVSIWDADIADPNYQVVADAMSALVKSRPIENVFLHTEKTAGTDKNFQQLLDGVKTWEHFFINVPTANVMKGVDIGTALGETRATHDVLYRSLTEITRDAVDTVLELIAQNSLYRGEEQKFAVDTFKGIKKLFDAHGGDKDAFAWSHIKRLPQSVSRIRNTAIGTLLTDISEGKDLEAAVGSFEAKVAPTNYKRPTTLITKAMIEQARKKIDELGLTSALDRRYATIVDITANNVLFADRTSKSAMKGDVFSELSAQAPVAVKNLDKVEEVPVEKFIADMLPSAESIEVMFENRHTGNLVSLVAPTDPTAGELFKWPNKFSWSYNGELADSIKERVKKAGGNVSGDLCCRLAWYNHDDLDFHMTEPNGHEIYYPNKGRRSPCGGILDVDMNAGHGTTRDPVENIYYGSRMTMKEGSYVLRVHNFNRRESDNVGFEAEIDYLGTVHRFVYDKPVKNNETITVADLKYTYKGGLEFVKSMPSTQRTKAVWSISTQTFHKASVIMLSPNHWDGNGVGNKHYFFMIDGCLNDGSARGFFNEFLKADLDPHRKVFEVVGSKMKTAESTNQLSGLGFSSTQRNSVLCRVKGSFSRIIKITF